ncbi:hypothetical protein PAXINDRAFT_15936 [Paxillus involutus ATCC 200175]|uniref:Uncharacterized protein n=1 Tax=Paxillus involutus ATCC 200175 TaxID=664439 RepID=A0A0C9TV33_PAXIN|nr:hypothetical protein PAXINDRAFT_15936 [Paxillus involutus ATCC 200175]
MDQQPDAHLQATAQSQNISPDRPFSPASVISSVPEGTNGGHRGAQRVLKPTIADMVMERRYSRKGQADSKMQYDGAVAPGERDYNEVCPPGWTRLIQAEGASYYYHSQEKALAIMQSVPYALLIWGMLSFVMALGFVIFGSPRRWTIIAAVSPGWALITYLPLLRPLWGSTARKYEWWGKITDILPLIRPKRLPSLPTVST